MAVVSSLKKGIINPLTFLRRGPGPAKIYIEIEYDDKWKYLLGYKGFKQQGSLLGGLITAAFSIYTGFKINPPQNQVPIRFQIPVMPPTIQIDTGSGNESTNVAQIGEVVMPKYMKAKQFRFESFFPYDDTAPYINTTVRQSGLKGLASTAVGLIRDLTEITKATANPEVYINIFEELSKSQIPLKISMNFYQGGNIYWTPVTVNTFQYEPENNGDYKYSLSLVEWKDISPTKLNNDGTPAFKSTNTLKDIICSAKSKVGQTIGYASEITKWWNICKGAYSIVSKNLIFWVAKYNGIKNLTYINKGDFTWKFKSSFQSYATRYSIQPNMLGKPSISSSDTPQISESLKKLSFTKASKQMEDYLKDLGYDTNRT